jgi:Arc/MetJ family transcription regulator
MARKKTTVYLDEDLITATKVLAATSGRREYEVVEEALRQYVGGEESRAQLRSLLDRVARRSTLKDKEAMDLAYSELGAGRKERSGRRRK